MRGTGTERLVVAEKLGKAQWSEGVASSSLRRRSTARAGGASESSKAVQYFQENRVGGVRTGQSESGSRRSRCGIDRDVRARLKEQPLSDLESHVVGNVLPSTSTHGGDTEERRRREALGHSDGVRPGCSNGGQTVLGADGGTVLPSRLLWLSASQIRARCRRQRAAAMLALRLGHRPGYSRLLR
jgi:hypothetical protein